MHCRPGLIPLWRPSVGFVRAALPSKKRVPVPEHPVHRTRSPSLTGCPEGISARRTLRALDERGFKSNPPPTRHAGLDPASPTFLLDSFRTSTNQRGLDFLVAHVFVEPVGIDRSERRSYCRPKDLVLSLGLVDLHDILVAIAVVRVLQVKRCRRWLLRLVFRECPDRALGGSNPTVD